MIEKSPTCSPFDLVMDTIGKRVSFLSNGQLFSPFGWERESWRKPFILLCLSNEGTWGRADFFGREVAH
jgi:hypothetical protein